MRRASVSIPSNIAEGKGRHTNPEFKQFLIQARGSLLELEKQIQIAENLSYIEPEKAVGIKSKASDVGKMLSGLIEAMGQKTEKNVSC